MAFTPILPSSYRQDPSAVRGATFNWSVFRRMLRLSRRRWRLVAVLMSLVVAGSLLTLIPPLLFRRIIDHDIPARSTGSIVTDGLLAFAAFSVGLLLSAFGHLVAAYVSTGVILDIRHALFDKFQRLPHLFFTRARLGMITSRFMNDVTNAQQLITVTFGSALGTVVTFGSTLVVMALLSWQVTLFALIAVPAFVIPSLLLSRRVQVAARDQMQRFGELTAFLNERFDVNGSLLVKLYSRHDHETVAFGRRANAIRSNGIRLTLLTQSMTLTTALIGIGGVVATYIYGGIEVAHRALTIGTMVALSTYILQAATPVFALSNVRSTFLQAQVSLDRVFEVLDTPDDSPHNEAVDGKGGPIGDVVFSKVCFGYPPAGVTLIASLEAVPAGIGQHADPWALRDVTFVAPASTITALVGPSGSGKSTLCGLLAGLFRPDSGSISIGGTDISRLSGAQIRDSVGMVTQDPFFFHDTIAGNLRLANPDATDDELVHACMRANIHNLIVSLPDRYETLVGERGHRFSGGEKQRLAVARLLLKDPAIVILDEATAHLDSHAERLVKDALDIALRGRTALVIAHRLSTVLTADQILVLIDGHITERGRHSDLINDGGAYASLYNAQFSPS